MVADLIERPTWGGSEIEWKAWRRAQNQMARPIVEAALALGGVSSKIGWSAKRLCRCGCSAAWILTDGFSTSFEITEVRS